MLKILSCLFSIFLNLLHTENPVILSGFTLLAVVVVLLPILIAVGCLLKSYDLAIHLPQTGTAMERIIRGDCV